MPLIRGIRASDVRRRILALSLRNSAEIYPIAGETAPTKPSREITMPAAAKIDPADFCGRSATIIPSWPNSFHRRRDCVTLLAETTYQVWGINRCQPATERNRRSSR